MICPFCNRNVATIHLTEVINGKVKETHICEKCAKNKGIKTELPFSFGDILTALTEGIMDMHQADEAGIIDNPKCSSCGLTIHEFIKQGRLGCAGCYETFSDALNDIVRNLQKSPSHAGKSPKVFPRFEDTSRRITELEIKLQHAVEKERYEDCVAYRDEINRLKQALKGS